MDAPIVSKEFQLSKSEYSCALRRIMLHRSAKGLLFLWLIVGYLILSYVGDYSGSTLWAVLAGSLPLLLASIGGTLWVLVITAAAKSRTSFGCSNENEYTYFGEAYFKHALTDTFSFVEAYEIARKRVTEREQGEDLEPSRPMLHLGKALEAHLQQLEQRLALQR